ncbi:peptidoglycan DD-metalloendopeptidase family protein [[Kitasatospora] papulosa]|uniref:peptidoglycan DD-metalloendopeptidase family protein n=1 Tax=[Kitasatospora] papulosa TaxID=1464011 RepID=UPI0036763AA6
MTSVGSVSLRVSPDVSRFGQELSQRLRATGTQTVSVLVEIDRRSLAGFRAQVANLIRPIVLPVHIQIDRASIAAYRAQVANLVRPQTADINVNLRGDSAARARLDALANNRTSNVRVDVDRGASGLIGGITSAASSAMGMVAGLASKVAMLGSAAPLVGVLVSVVAAIAPAAAVALPAVAMLGSAIGAIKLGTSGLGEAFKEAFNPAASAASGAASATRQVEQAQRGLADAHRAVGDAQRAASEQVAQAQKAVAAAERDLADAQMDAKSAQEDLNDARKDAKRALQDMNLQLSGSKLDEQEAILRVQEAQEKLNKTLADPRASALDRREAELRFQQAQQGLKEQQVETKRLADDTKAANKAGVEGSGQVRDAKDRLSKANQNVADRALAVKDAESAVAKAQADGARQVADAQRAVADASRALSDAQSASAAQTAKLSENFSKLSPNAQGFVNAVKGLKPAWDSMQLGVQDRLFSGLGSRLSDVGGRVIPILRGGLESTAGVLNKMAQSSLDAVNNLAKTGMLKQIFDGATKSLSPLSRIPGQLVTGFGQVAVAAQPAFQRITEGVAGAADGISAKLTKAFESGAMEKAIDTAVTLLGDLMDIAGNVMSILGDIFMAGEDTGGGTIGVLKTITEEISKITSSPEVQGGLKALFSVMGSIAKTVAPLLGTALKFVGEIFQKLGPPVEILVKALGDALTPVIDALGPVLVIVADVLGKILVAISPLIVVIGELLATALKPLGPIFEIIGGLIEKLTPVVAILADALGQVLTPILEGLGEVLTELVSQYADQFVEILNELLPIIPQLIPPLVGMAKSIGDLLFAIAPLLPQLMLLGTQFLVMLLPAILPLIPPILRLVEVLLGLATDAIEKYVLPALQKFIDYVNEMRPKLQPFVDAVAWCVDLIAKGFEWLSDWLVGHSVIPDMIKLIRDWFDKGKTWIKLIWDKIWENTIGRATDAAVTVGAKVLGFVQGIRDRFNDAKRWVKEKWDGLWSGVSGTVTTMRKGVEDKVRDFKDNVIGFFQKAIDGIKTVWNKLQDISKKPVKFMIQTVFNDGIVKVWNNTAAKLPGIGKISEMKLPKGFASGGVLPGYTPGKDVHRFVSPTGGMLDLSGGEGILRPEVTRVVGKSGIDTLNMAARQGGVQGVKNALSNGIPHQRFFGGGIFGDAWDAITNNPVADKVKDVVGKGVDWARGGLADLAEKALKALLGTLTVPTLKNAKWTDAVKGIPVTLADKIVDFIRGKEAESGGSGSWMKPVNAPYGTKFGVKGSMWSSGRHTGLDFPAAVGTAIKAVAAGRVSSVGSGGPYGKHMTVDHGGGLQSLYAHMSQIVAKAKENLAAGSAIGKVGATGNVTGPHLHLEARVNSKSVDPMPYLTGGGSVSYKPGAGVKQWTGVVQQALSQVGQPQSLTNTTLRRMNQESGGNPKAVNLWDSNAKAGYPSVGLMQVIRPTFQAHAGKYRNKGPFMYGTSIDPLANVYASMRYALSAYGSLSRAYDRPGGYDNGGWLPDGISTVNNQTGEPEAILNPQQWQSMITLAEQVKRGQAGGHQITVNNPPQPTGEKQVAAALYRSELLGR